MVLTLLALTVGVLCLAAAVRRWRSLLRMGPRRLEPLGGAALATRPEVARAAARLLGEHAAEELLHDVLDAPSRRHAVAELNEHLSEAARSIDLGAEVPRSAARVALATGTLLGVIELVRTLPGGGVSVGWALGAFGCGAASALATQYTGRLADCRARQLRDAWNALAAAITRLLPPPPSGEPSARAGEPLARLARDWCVLDRWARRR